MKDITDNYLKLEEFSYENVDRASKACGPLQKWVASQLHYSTILKKVGEGQRTLLSCIMPTAMQMEASVMTVSTRAGWSPA